MFTANQSPLRSIPQAAWPTWPTPAPTPSPCWTSKARREIAVSSRRGACRRPHLRRTTRPSSLPTGAPTRSVSSIRQRVASAQFHGLPRRVGCVILPDSSKAFVPCSPATRLWSSSGDAEIRPAQPGSAQSFPLDPTGWKPCSTWDRRRCQLALKHRRRPKSSP